jgi:chromosome partitioning protein
MPFVLAVAGQKGGAGKTTLSVNMAEALRVHYGKRVVIVDTDPQGTAQTWRDWAEQQGHHDVCTVVGSTGFGLRSVLATLEGAAEVIVIDTPPRMEEESHAAMAVAHLVLAPVAPGPADVWALDKTAKQLGTVRATRADHGPRCVAVLNRAMHRTALSRAMPESVAGAGFEVARCALAHRVAFPEALAAGQGVVTYEPEGQAAQELRALIDEVLG